MAAAVAPHARLPRSRREIVSVIVCLTLVRWSVWVRIPAAIYGVYLGTMAVLILTWGLCFERAFARVVVGASLGAIAATVVAFVGMLLPNEEHARRCAEPGMYCEDFSGALLIYGAPFVLLGVPALTVAVHAAALGLGRVARRLTRADVSAS
jgi:hypothetical protein